MKLSILTVDYVDTSRLQTIYNKPAPNLCRFSIAESKADAPKYTIDLQSISDD